MKKELEIWLLCANCEKAFLRRRYKVKSLHCFCSNECKRQSNNVLRMKVQNPEDNYNKYVIKSEDPDACWGWSGKVRSGYGTFYRQGVEKGKDQAYLAHRFSYELHEGPIPDGLMVRHLCNNRICTNPKHLEVGTNADNQKDKALAGTVKGEGNPRCSISKETALGIKELVNTGTYTAPQIAKMFNTTKGIVQSIKLGRTWTWLTKDKI